MDNINYYTEHNMIHYFSCKKKIFKLLILIYVNDRINCYIILKKKRNISRLNKLYATKRKVRMTGINERQ